MVSTLLVGSLTALTLIQSPDSVGQKHRMDIRFAFGGDTQLTQDPLPATIGGRYVGNTRSGGTHLIGQLNVGLTKRLSLLGQIESTSVYGGSTALLFDRDNNVGGLSEKFVLPDYPTFYVQNTISNYTNYDSYRRALLVGLGYDVLLRRHWWIRLSVLGGPNLVLPLGQSILLKEKGSNYTRAIDYLPLQRMGYGLYAEVAFGYKFRVAHKQEFGISFDHALTGNRLPIVYQVQSTDILGQTTQTEINETFMVWLRRVQFGLQFWF
jgi:hypothetical protein